MDVCALKAGDTCSRTIEAGEDLCADNLECISDDYDAHLPFTCQSMIAFEGKNLQKTAFIERIIQDLTTPLLSRRTITVTEEKTCEFMQFLIYILFCNSAWCVTDDFPII